MARRRRMTFGEPDHDDRLIDAIQEASRPLRGRDDLDPLLDRIGDARYVLLGEATHGTAEFYSWRRTISQRLIEEKEFSFVAVEGDWPDCYRVNRFVQGNADAGETAREVLSSFERWPTWMWANEEVVALAEWLRLHNDALPPEQRVGFYGLDVYSLWDSMRAVLEYLQRNDGAVSAARRAFECFEPYGEDVQEYARATAWAPATCEEEVVQMLQEIRRGKPSFDDDGRDAYFNAEQNALVARNAEDYYRTMVRGDSPSWNVRDRHMAETLNRLVMHYPAESKAIVWEHNTHIGDARYTDMAEARMVNVGQLVREEHADDGVVLVGFSTHSGTAIAADGWGQRMRRMKVPAARAGSWEERLHQADHDDKLLLFDFDENRPEMLEERGHRAVGVVYRPQNEGYGNYVPTVMPKRYDVLLHLDETEALHPLHWQAGVEQEMPETYPSGL